MFSQYKGTSITIPSSVTSIESYAFAHCDSLTSITIPDSVTSIGYNAFYNCSNLTSIIIGSDVTSIESYAFAHCDSLTSITIPNSVTSIGDNAFSGCSSLINVYYKGDIEDWCNIYFSDDASNPMFYADNLYINEKLLEGELVISSSVTNIGQYAFYSCDSLTSITISDSVTSIENYAFAHCDSLTSITIPNSVTSIENYAFAYCDSLIIYCEASSEPSGWDYYWNRDWDYSQLPVVWDCNNNDIASNGYIYTIIDGIRYALKDKTAMVTKQPYTISDYIIIPSSVTYKENIYSVTSIEDRAFSGCSNLTSIEIPSSVTSIEDRAFFKCTSLTRAVFNNPDNWEISSSSSFSNPFTYTISSSDLSNSYTAAKYLTSTYSAYYWRRG